MVKTLNIDAIYSLEKRLLYVALQANLKRGMIFSFLEGLAIAAFATILEPHQLTSALLFGLLCGLTTYLYLAVRYRWLYRRQLRELLGASQGKSVD